VRRATLSLDSDLPPDGDLLVRAARGAVWLADLPLADRLAEAATRAGAGPEPSFIRAHALSWLGRGEQADAVLAAIDAGTLSETERARLAFLRASNMLWVLGSPAAARRLIDDVSSSCSPQARVYADAFLAVCSFAMDEPVEAMRHSEHLAVEHLPGIVGAEIAWVLAAISADAGRTATAVAVAEAGYTVATRSFDAPQMTFNIADAHVSALLLSGRIHDALAVTERVREQAANLPGSAQLLGAAVAGRVALGAGRLQTACLLLEQATVALSSAGYSTGWGYRYRVAYATALAVRGATADAASVLSALEKLPRRFRSLDYERNIARAWVAAGQGAVSEAVTLALSASETARNKGQFAAEVACLQTATQFGDRSGATRLRELESIVEGPRAGFAARFAEALDKADANELAALAEEFENIGDLVTAVDCAAHAAIGYRGQGLRGSALTCSSRATALAEQCGGLSSPALRVVSGTLPLTSREREIVMLVAEGLSNQAVAERLTLSVRTVESHIYRAMLKTGTTGRDELGGLLPPKKPPDDSRT
jgi:DNA-binding CsgD family transcriptional regulator